MNKTSPFDSFKQNKTVDYAVTTKFVLEDNGKDVNEIKQKDKETHSKKLGFSIASGALLLGFGALALVKGLPKGSYKKLDKWIEKLEIKTANIADNNRTFMETAYLQCLKKLKSASNKVKTVFNLTTLKDIVFDKIARKNSFLGKFCDKATAAFEKVSVKTSEKSYNKTMKKFAEMVSMFGTTNSKLLAKDADRIVTINGKSQTVQKWIEEASRRINTVQNTCDSSFGTIARQKRLKSVKASMKDLFKQTWDAMCGNPKKTIKNKKLYNTFIPEELAMPAKNKLADEVNGLRRIITNDISDNYLSSKNILGSINSLLEPTDKGSREIIKGIRESLEAYKGLAGSAENVERAEIQKRLAKQLSGLASNMKKSELYDEKTAAQVGACIKDMNNVLQKNKKGELQEILTIYKNLMPRDEYLKIKTNTYGTVKSLDKSIDLETDKLFDKLRDLRLGSAPTDLVLMLPAMATVALGLGKADDNDERVSVALKYGIPALGAIATSLYCTVGLVSGGSSIIFGLLAGAAINKVGETLDNAIKKYKTDKTVLPQGLTKADFKPFTNKKS